MERLQRKHSLYISEPVSYYRHPTCSNMQKIRKNILARSCLQHVRFSRKLNKMNTRYLKNNNSYLKFSRDVKGMLSMPIIPVSGRLRNEDHKVETHLGNLASQAYHVSKLKNRRRAGNVVQC